MTPSDQQIHDSLVSRLNAHHNKDISKSDRVTLCFRGLSIECDRIPLVRESKFFEAVFTNENFADSGKKSFVLKNEEFSMFAFAKVIEFIFDKYDLRSKNVWEYRRRKLEMDLELENFQSVVELSSYLQVEDMDKACTWFIVDQLELDNVVDVFEMSLRLNMDRLMEASKLYVGYHLPDLLPELDMQNISLDFARMVLSLEKAKIPNESLMLDFTWKWVKSDLENRKQLLGQLLALVRTQHVADEKLKKVYKKITKKIDQSDSLPFQGICIKSKQQISSTRSWPKLLVLCDSLVSSDCDLQELTFTEIKQLLSQVFSVWPIGFQTFACEKIDPPNLGLKLDAITELVFAGVEDSIFVIVKNRVGEIEETDECDLTIWVNNLGDNHQAWAKLAHHQPREMNQLINIRAKFCWNILFLTGDLGGSPVAYYLDQSSYEPEWRQWTFSCPTLHSVAGLCATGPPGQRTLWVVTAKKMFCPCTVCKKTHDSELTLPSGRIVKIRQLAGPEDVAQPRLSAYQDTVMAVGGQDPNTAKCMVYHRCSSEWVQNDDLWLGDGRREPGVVTVGSEVFAFGGKGFFWDETITSVERLDWKGSGGWKKKEGSRVNMRGSLTALDVNTPLSWLLGREKHDTAPLH